jgi:hypothetical protein
MVPAVDDGMVDPDIIFYTEKAWFHLSCHVNSQNSRCWSAENLHTIHEVLLHDVKIGVWCAISVHRIIAIVFF